MTSPPPYPEAQEVSKRLVQSLDHLLSNYKDEPEARTLLQLDGPPTDGAPAKHVLMRQLFEIGQGTHDTSQVDEQLVLRQATDMTAAAIDTANMLFGRRQPTPTTSATTPPTKKYWDFLSPLRK